MRKTRTRWYYMVTKTGKVKQIGLVPITKTRKRRTKKRTRKKK